VEKEGQRDGATCIPERVFVFATYAAWYCEEAKSRVNATSLLTQHNTTHSLFPFSSLPSLPSLPLHLFTSLSSSYPPSLREQKTIYKNNTPSLRGHSHSYLKSLFKPFTMTGKEIFHKMKVPFCFFSFAVILTRSFHCYTLIKLLPCMFSSILLTCFWLCFITVANNLVSVHLSVLFSVYQFCGLLALLVFDKPCNYISCFLWLWM